MTVLMRMAALMAAVAAIGLLAACGSDDSGSSSTAAGDAATTAESGEKANIALFVLATANPFSQGHVQGVEKAAEAAGAKVTVFDGGFDASRQYNQIQDAAASGRYNAFIVVANDGTTVEPAVKDAIDQGVKVASIHTPIGPDLNSCDDQVGGLVAHLCRPFKAEGEWLGEQTIAACDGKDPCKAALMVGTVDAPFDNERVKGFREVVGRADNVQIVAVGSGEYLRDKSLAVASDQLARTPDVDTWATSGDQITLGIEQALEDAGRRLGLPKDGAVALISTGAGSAGVAGIKERNWFADYLSLPITEGAKAAELVTAAVANGSSDFTSIVSATDLTPLEGGEPFITKENVGDFAGETEG